MKTAFVTGGSGHLGANLVRNLIDSGWNVRCLIHKDEEPFIGLNIEKVYGDLSNASILSEQMEGCEVVFHLAAYVDIENVNIPLMKKINILGTQNMCEAALKCNVKRFIYFSSIHAFDQKPTHETLTENRPLVTDPSSPLYDQTKAIAQTIVYDACKKGLNASILHPTGVLGPFDYKPSRMGKVLMNISNRKMLIQVDAGFNWIDARDVADTAIQCVDFGEKGKNYIVSGTWASFKEISDIVAKLINKRTSLIIFPLWVTYTAIPFAYVLSKIFGNRPSFSRGSIHALAIQSKKISNNLAKNKLNHRVRDLEETIRDTLSWNQKNAN